MTQVMNKASLKISKVVLSTKPEKAAGNDQMWEQAIKSLEIGLREVNLSYEIAEGDGAFYGPKIGFEMEDNFGRIWSCGTIQLDFVQPENFDLHCINHEGKEERIVVIHQALFGSLERFFAICLEHHRGKLPYWMAPIQVKIIAITEKQQEYCQELYKKLLHLEVRAEFDNRMNEPLNAQLQKSILANNYFTLIVGRKEVENNTVSVRHNYTNKQEVGITFESFMSMIKEIE